MLSKYVGKDFGIAKRCNPVMVKIPFDEPPQTWLNTVSVVVDDIKTRRVQKAVLSMSFYFPLEELKEPDSTETDEGLISNLWQNLKELDRLNVVLVAASGNGAIGNAQGSKDMDGYPAIMGSSKIPLEKRIPNMIVVGALKAATGKMWQNTNFDNAKGLPHVFAPGQEVKCWNRAPTIPGFPHVPVLTDGTSPGIFVFPPASPENVNCVLATASVAGLAAYFMSLPGGPNSPAAVKKKVVEETAWKQGNGGTAGAINPPVTGMLRIWNGVVVENLLPAKPKPGPWVGVRGVDWRKYEN
jgi:hypothetical protein